MSSLRSPLENWNISRNVSNEANVLNNSTRVMTRLPNFFLGIVAWNEVNKNEKQKLREKKAKATRRLEIPEQGFLPRRLLELEHSLSIETHLFQFGQLGRSSFERRLNPSLLVGNVLVLCLLQSI